MMKQKIEKTADEKNVEPDQPDSRSYSGATFRN